MPTDVIPRGAVTDALVNFLRASTPLSAAHIVIGDGVPPDNAGWPGGQADVGNFVASATVETQEAGVRSSDTLAGHHASWALNYGLRYAGAARGQADGVADLVRAEVLKMVHADIGTHWKLTDVLFTRLAPVTLDKSTDPPIWSMLDTVQLWVDRKRG